mgnify:CR=1 FL=1
MELKEYKARVIDKKIDTYLKIFGAVLIEGPKWCGKTRTSRFHSQSQFFLANPKGNFNNKRIAEMDPDLVLDGSTPRLIDEWQEAPAIWDAVRGRVDRAPAALPAALGVVPTATTRQITISTIPHIIIYIRAVTLLYMAVHFVVHGYPSCYIRCPLCLQVCPLRRTYYPLRSSVSHSHFHAASHQSNFVTRNTSIKLRNNHFKP